MDEGLTTIVAARQACRPGGTGSEQEEARLLKVPGTRPDHDEVIAGDAPRRAGEPSEEDGEPRAFLDRIGLCLDFRRDRKNSWTVTAVVGPARRPLEVDTLNLFRADARKAFIDRLVGKLACDEGTALEVKRLLGEKLVEAAAEEGHSASDGAPGVHEAGQYVVVDDEEEPERNGFYSVGPDGRRQLSNFVIELGEDLIVEDEIAPTRKFRGRITCLGRTSDFEVAAEQFAGERLREAIFAAAGPKAELLGRVDEIRTATSRTSEAAVRRVTTGVGWSDDLTRFLLPGGYVDADGYHDNQPGGGTVEVDLPEKEAGIACRLGMMRLEPEELRLLVAHLREDLLTLNERRVTRSVLAAVALAVLRRFTPEEPVPAIWLQGPSGGGKTLLARLAASFFGDPGAGQVNRLASWNSTANYVQRLGYYFRDCLYAVDDYKPELVKPADLVRILQNHSDAAGRGRLNADASVNVTRPIRGLLLSTGEDVPAQTSSGLARTVVVFVPGREKDQARRDRCIEASRRYRGLMGAFLSGVIRDDRGRQFAERVKHWRGFYYGRIAGRQNDDRIATNHALLAAAFEQFASYLGQSWDGAGQEAEEFATGDLASMVRDAAGDVEDETAAIFLATLRDLIRLGRVSFEGLGPTAFDGRDQAEVIGHLVDSRGRGNSIRLGRGCVSDHAVIEVTLGAGLGAVQSALRQQSRPTLQVTNKALIQQLVEAGVLLDQDDEPITPESKGHRTWQARVGGKRPRVIRMKAATLGEPTGQGEPGTSRLGIFSGHSADEDDAAWVANGA
jgi:hypothetical protein